MVRWATTRHFIHGFLMAYLLVHALSTSSEAQCGFSGLPPLENWNFEAKVFFPFFPLFEASDYARGDQGTASACQSGWASSPQISFGSSPFDVQARSEATRGGTILGPISVNLGVYASIQVDKNSAAGASVTARASYWQNFRISGENSLPVAIPGDNLIAKLRMEGQTALDTLNVDAFGFRDFSGSSAAVDLFTEPDIGEPRDVYNVYIKGDIGSYIQFWVEGWDPLVIEETGLSSVSYVVTLDLAIPVSYTDDIASGSIYLELEATASADPGKSAVADWFDTLVIESFMLQDGRTLEEAGLQLDFEPVPEPTTLTMLSVLGGLASLLRLRQRRQ